MQSADPISWDALVQSVRTEYPSLYRAWFDALPPGQLQGGQLTVQVTDPVWARYLREHCAHAFAQVAMQMTGRLIPVSFVAPDSAPPPAPSNRGTRLTQIPLNPDYTFPEFVVGPSNRLGHAACRAACNQPGTLYNPLFIHGASGLGKTHLLQAVCAELLRSRQGLHVVYGSCETFVNDYVRAIETGELPAFRDLTWHTDVLVLDDVQFLANRESTQEELFHTFNVLHQNRRQIVLSADVPPSEIPTLEDRLVSRFNWGLVAQIDAPNRETRQAIFQKKARLRGCDVPADVLDYIAERVESNIRALEGALTRLLTEHQLNGKPLTIETAREAVPSTSDPDHRPLQIMDILQAVSKHYGIRLQELLGARRRRSIVRARHIAMYLARELTSLSLQEIGTHFGRDHSTVLHGEQAIERSLEHDPQTSEALAVLKRQLLALSATGR